MWPLCPGQSFDHLAMNVAIMPLRCARTLVKVLNSAALSAASSAPSIVDRRLEHARAGLLVQAFDAEIHRLAHRQQLVIELRGTLLRSTE